MVVAIQGGGRDGALSNDDITYDATVTSYAMSQGCDLSPEQWMQEVGSHSGHGMYVDNTDQFVHADRRMTMATFCK